MALIHEKVASSIGKLMDGFPVEPQDSNTLIEKASLLTNAKRYSYLVESKGQQIINKIS